MTLVVLRLLHRIIRDKRMTTHLALSARAFGSSSFFYSGDHDSGVEESISDVVLEWGGEFNVEYLEKPSNFIKEWKSKGGIIIHLTMYGIELSNLIESMKNMLDKDLLVVVGGAKVPGFVYQLADYNIAIGHQPHSEIAALSVFLDNLSKGEARKIKHPDAKINIVPTERGKQAEANRKE
ncbi:MAG: tRNA (cytidine(56)-2'-O)-methyltransferase [Candidatus Heimdallarchaeota archaeon]|nr:tRNA (cytidine(56)-2'-O)-methyltransferase [Candidatus Heimdallarchaeota archaeon]MCK4877022.1 tRNA (cytidine(56)-2'-O)-methyltransferase [Candidatus Heimdallarchaeota archaeon]